MNGFLLNVTCCVFLDLMFVELQHDSVSQMWLFSCDALAAVIMEVTVVLLSNTIIVDIESDECAGVN